MTQQLMTVASVQKELAQMQKELKSLLPAHVTVENFSRTVVMAVQQNPYLLKLDQQSLFESCRMAASDGLALDGRQAALVPFGKKVSYIPMYQGLLNLARRSDEIGSIFCHVVTVEEFNAKRFKYWIDMNGQNLEHKPDLSNKGELFCAYMFATLKDGSKQIEVVSGDYVRNIRNDSLSKIKEDWKLQKSPWVKHEISMWLKTALRSGLKLLPQSKELVQANNNEFQQTEIDVTPESKSGSTLKPLSETIDIIEPSMIDLPPELM